MQKLLLLATALLLLAGCGAPKEESANAAPASTKPTTEEKLTQASEDLAEQISAVRETAADVETQVAVAKAKLQDKWTNVSAFLENDGAKVLALFAKAKEPEAVPATELEALGATDAVWQQVQGYVSGGLSDTLVTAVRRSVEELGKPDGFLKNSEVRINLPESFDPAKKALSAIGQEQLLTNFETTMNRAAEDAVRASPDILINAIEKMTVNDVHAIWQGGDTAISDYFQRTTRTDLETVMLPVIQKATEQSGAAQAYKNLQSALNQEDGLAGGLNKLSGALGKKSVGDAVTIDLDQYVLDESLSGLFKVLASEEQKIRQDPTARSTELIKALFGK